MFALPLWRSVPPLTLPTRWRVAVVRLQHDAVSFCQVAAGAAKSTSISRTVSFSTRQPRKVEPSIAALLFATQS